jgi:hypothetical protein
VGKIIIYVLFDIVLLNSIFWRHILAIFGFGSNWGGEEVKETFFAEEEIIIGWNDETAVDVYSLVSSLKIGDIIYLKSNQPGSRTVKVKGIGIITRNFIECIKNNDYSSTDFTDWNSFFIKVKWIIKEEFIINIPENVGRLTNIRAATVYEEYLPFVQNKIVEKIFEKIK